MYKFSFSNSISPNIGMVLTISISTLNIYELFFLQNLM